MPYNREIGKLPKDLAVTMVHCAQSSLPGFEEVPVGTCVTTTGNLQTHIMVGCGDQCLYIPDTAEVEVLQGIRTCLLADAAPGSCLVLLADAGALRSGIVVTRGAGSIRGYEVILPNGETILLPWALGQNLLVDTLLGEDAPNPTGTRLHMAKTLSPGHRISFPRKSALTSPTNFGKIKKQRLQTNCAGTLGSSFSWVEALWNGAPVRIPAGSWVELDPKDWTSRVLHHQP